MQAAELGDRLCARAEVEVVRVAEQDLGAERAQLVRIDAFDGRLRADGHERRRPQLAVRCAEHAGASSPVLREQRECVQETRHRRSSSVAMKSSNRASPRGTNPKLS